MFGLGTTELIIILVIMMMVFGLGKLPKVMGQLGKGVKEFKSSMDGEGEEEQPKLEDKSSTQSIRDAGVPQEMDESKTKSW